MDTETRAVVVDLVHIEAVEAVEEEETEPELELLLEPEPEHVSGRTGHRSEARSASRTAAVVAPTPPDPDYFVG